MSEGVRLQRYLSRAGRASRREAEKLMLAGRVRVNGRIASELGTRVVPGRDVVELDGEVVTVRPATWVALHKPPGVLTTRRDPHGGRTVYDLLPVHLSGLKYVGRLDKDAEGLLLLTNDGEGAHRVQHPRHDVEREYRAEVAGTLDQAVVRRLLAGVELDDGPARVRRAVLVGAGRVTSTLDLVLTEGRKREVRRLMSAVGHPVLRLVRTRYGPVRLGELARGQSRPLTEDEIEALLG